MARPTNLSSTATMTGQEPLSPFGFAVDLALPTNEVFSPLSLFRLLRLGRTRRVPSLMPASRSENLGESSASQPRHQRYRQPCHQRHGSHQCWFHGFRTRIKRNRHGHLR